MNPSWQNGKKVQAVAWLSALSLVSFVGLSVYGFVVPTGDGKVLMAAMAFLSTQAAAGISFLMGSSMPEQRPAHVPLAGGQLQPTPGPAPEQRG